MSRTTFNRLTIDADSSGRFYISRGLDDEWIEAPTLEMALILAIQNAGITGVHLAPTLQAAEVLESLLGAPK